jgi:hypothetical protein
MQVDAIIEEWKAMDQFGLTKFLAITLLVLLSGCKVVIEVPATGGKVVYQEGNEACLAGETCVVEVNDIFFSDSFVPVPDVGYRFAEWKKRERGLCGGSSKACDLSTSFLKDYPLLEAFLAPDELYYLVPVFKKNNDSHAGIQESVPCDEINEESVINFANAYSLIGGETTSCGFVHGNQESVIGDLAFFRMGDWAFYAEICAGVNLLNPNTCVAAVSRDLFLAQEYTDSANELYLDPDYVQGTASIILYLDVDLDAATGYPVDELVGADYRIAVNLCQLPGGRPILGFFQKWSDSSRVWSAVVSSRGWGYGGGTLGRVSIDWELDVLVGLRPEILGTTAPPVAIAQLERFSSTCDSTIEVIGTGTPFRLNNF